MSTDQHSRTGPPRMRVLLTLLRQNGPDRGGPGSARNDYAARGHQVRPHADRRGGETHARGEPIHGAVKPVPDAHTATLQ